MRFRSLPVAARLYIGGVVAAGFVALAWSVENLLSGDIRPGWLVLAALTLVSGSATVRLPSVAATISVSETFVFTSVLLFGAGAGTVTVALDAFVVSLWVGWPKHRAQIFRLLFNIAAPAISIWIAAAVFFWLAGIPSLSGVSGATSIRQLALPLLAFTLIYFLLNSWLIAFVISFTEKTSALAVWRDNLVWLSLNYFGGASVAALLVGYRGKFDPALVAIIVPILLVLYFTFKTAMGRVEDANRHLARVNSLYLSTIETLAMAIDAKDQVTHGHIRRVQTYAVELAKALEIRSEEQIRAIEAAALLHDMGKLAVPEYILNKPGPLSASEYARMKNHASVGADILSSIKFPYPVVPIVRYHHENWDGSGYPEGLKGTEIPIGARILSVVDCFDALTSDRPYRPRLSDDQAIQVLKERRGAMYDPLIVDTFLRLHTQLSLAEVRTPERREAVLAAITEAASSRFTATEAGSAVVDSRNMLALYELGRALSSNVMSIADVAELVGQHLQKVVTSRIYGFYLADHESNEIRIVHTVGDDAGLLLGLRIPFGSRLSGWVAANRGTIINSDPVLDLGENARKLPQPLSSCLSTAVVADGSLIGVLSLYSDKKFTQDDARVVEVVARHVASALRSASDIERRRSSLTDVITGLPTAEYLKDIVGSEIAAALAGEQAMSVILVDVDRLKEVNLRRGRDSGDTLLALVAAHIRGSLRTTDVLFRSVSDEFIVALPQTDFGSAMAIAERIRAITVAGPLSDTAVSVGAATAPADGYSLEELLRIARTRLRQASKPTAAGGADFVH